MRWITRTLPCVHPIQDLCGRRDLVSHDKSAVISHYAPDLREEKIRAVEVMRRMSRGNQRKLTGSKRDRFRRAFHEFTIQNSLLNRQPSRLLKHLRCDI